MLGIIIKFSTGNNAFLAFFSYWFTLFVSVTSSIPYFDLICVENNYAKCCQAQSFSPGSKISLCMTDIIDSLNIVQVRHFVNKCEAMPSTERLRIFK